MTQAHGTRPTIRQASPTCQTDNSQSYSEQEEQNFHFLKIERKKKLIPGITS